MIGITEPHAAAPTGGAVAFSQAHLQTHLAVADHRVRTLVVARREVDPDPDDDFRGLYLTDEQVDHLLTRDVRVPLGLPPELVDLIDDVERRADDMLARGCDVRLRRLAVTFDLSPAEVEILLLAALPDLDPSMERVYGYLNDDVSRRRLTVGLALEVLGLSPLDGAARGLLEGTPRLIEAGLVVRLEEDLPLLGRPLRVPDRVTAHLLGDDRVPAVLAPLLMDVEPTDVDDDALARALGAGSRLVHLRHQPGAAPAAAAVPALSSDGAPPLCFDMGAGRTPIDIEMARTIVREARLRGCGLYLHDVDEVATSTPAVIRTITDGDVPTVVHGRGAWDPALAARLPVLLDAPVPDATIREALWQRHLPSSARLGDPIRAMAAFALDPQQITLAAAAASAIARTEDREVTKADLQAGARAQNSSGLERLARRLEPVATWDDLVTSGSLQAQLQELTARARHRDTVLGHYGLGRKASAGRGVSGLFAGPSGTGKTLSAEVIAGSLGLDLYVIDLSTIVDKYIGETEKNLDRVFEQAEQVNGVLLFDEADALFGKRSDVGDAHDRYANVEVAYLLQRMEAFSGLAILTSNLRSNIDEAFTRRLDALIDFAKPEEADRLRLWRLNLPPRLPQEDDIDLSFLAQAFSMSGGEIRNVCITAAYLAVDADRPVNMQDLIRATAREYRKLGRMLVASEFGTHYRLLEGI